MFVLKTVVSILYLHAAAPVPYAEAVTFPFASRGECEAQSAHYGARVAQVAADELRKSGKRGTLQPFTTSCQPAGPRMEANA